MCPDWDRAFQVLKEPDRQIETSRNNECHADGGCTMPDDLTPTHLVVLANAPKSARPTYAALQ
jgi:hypothetical protein